jgi:Holin of 3TMs, for gene-transfer release
MAIDPGNQTNLAGAQPAAVTDTGRDGWLQRSWRPVMMLAIVAIIFNDYVLFPYLSLFASKIVVIQLPEKLYNLMMIGIGAYIPGRSIEKGLAIWRDRQDAIDKPAR